MNQMDLPGMGRDWRKDAALRPQPKRDGDDSGWDTPQCVCSAATRFVVPMLPPGPILEPCPGAGHLVAALQTAGRKIIAGTGDFLTDTLPPDVRIALTNPPWNRLGAFVDR
jgi:hypothetical protein